MKNLHIMGVLIQKIWRTPLNQYVEHDVHKGFVVRPSHEEPDGKLYSVVRLSFRTDPLPIRLDDVQGYPYDPWVTEINTCKRRRRRKPKTENRSCSSSRFSSRQDLQRETSGTQILEHKHRPGLSSSQTYEVDDIIQRLSRTWSKKNFSC